MSRTAATIAILGLWPALAAADPQPIDLSLLDCARLALSADPRLRLKQADEEQARLLIGEERGAFFPTLSATLSFRRETDATPYAYMESGLYDVSTLTYGAALAGNLPTATRYELTLGSSVVWTDLRAAVLSPQHASSLQLRLTQPLLRGWGWRNTVSRLEVARIDHKASLAEVEAEVSALLLKVVRAYWSLAERRQEMEIAGELLELARRQLAATRARVKAGMLSRLELIEADAAIAARRGDLVAGEQATLGAERDLLLLIHSVAPGRPSLDLSRPLRPVESDVVTSETRSQSDLSALALRDRPEARAAELQLRARAEAARAAGNASLPRLDLEGIGGLAALSGSSTCQAGAGCVEPAALLRGGHGTAWKQVFTGQLPYWQLGLRLELPLSSDVRRKEVARAALERRRFEAALVGLRSRITVEVRDALLRLGANTRRLSAAELGLSVARQNLAAHESKFKAGVCTSYDVLRVQFAVGQARRDVAQARRDALIARAELEAAIGRLPQSLGVALRA